MQSFRQFHKKNSCGEIAASTHLSLNNDSTTSVQSSSQSEQKSTYFCVAQFSIFVPLIISVSSLYRTWHDMQFVETKNLFELVFISKIDAIDSFKR